MKKILFVWLVFFTAGHAISQQSPVFPVDKLLEDHQILITALKELHPGIYRYQTKDAFNREEQQLRQLINKPMTEEEYYRLVMPFIAGLKCGHTKWHRKDRPDDRFPFQQTNVFPLKLFFKDGRAWVLHNYEKGNMLKPGVEITAINGKNIKEIIAQLRKYMTIDGDVQSALYQELNQYFNGYYASFVGTAPQYVVRYKTGKKESEAILGAISLEVLKAREEQDRLATVPAFELSLPKRDVAVLRISRFYTNKGEPDYYKFIDSAFQHINASGTKSLVIDLRGNEGGVEEYGGYLFSWLATGPFTYYKKIMVASNKESSVKKYGWFPPGLDQAMAHIQEKDGEYFWPMQEYLATKEPKANAFKGRVFILTDGFSFSVTTEFASAIKTANRAVFVGEETGGAYGGDNSGVFASITLPNTKLTAGIPLLAFYMDTNGNNPVNRGIIPDKPASPGWKDVLTKKDVVLEAALKDAR